MRKTAKYLYAAALMSNHMTKARTTETLLRGEDYTFCHSEEKNGIKRDVFTSGDRVELNLDYNLDGTPVGVAVTAIAYGIDHLSVYDESGNNLTDEQVEVLAYELLDDQPKVIERMTGITAVASEDGPAYV